MAPPVDKLYTLARACLDAIVDRWDPDAEPLPGKQYVSNGIVIWDECEQLAVEVEGTSGSAGDVAAVVSIEQQFAAPGFAMRAASVAIWLIRCVHDIKASGAGDVLLPSADEMEADAQILLADPTAMMNALVAAAKAGELATCNGVAFDTWTAQGPDGGLGGGVLRVRLALY